ETGGGLVGGAVRLAELRLDLVLVELLEAGHAEPVLPFRDHRVEVVARLLEREITVRAGLAPPDVERAARAVPCRRDGGKWIAHGRVVSWARWVRVGSC